MLYRNAGLVIFFGDRDHAVDPDDLKKAFSVSALTQHQAIADIQRNMGIVHNALFFLHQTHSTVGMSVSTSMARDYQPFSRDGDFLVTNEPVSLGILSADCLPIILYDPIHRALALVHAGWRGAVAGVVQHALRAMQQQYGTHAQDLQVIFGPAAKPCCYEVGADLVERVMQYPFGHHSLLSRQGTSFFDNACFNALLLEQAGVPTSAFSYQYNNCTICDQRFCSYRRDKTIMRQMTIACLI